VGGPVRLSDETPYVICIGGGPDAVKFIEENCAGGLIFREDSDPFYIVCQIKDAFLIYMQLERNLLEALLADCSVQKMLDCCAEFFKNHVILFDNELNLWNTAASISPRRTTRSGGKRWRPGGASPPWCR
jgi:hypothetical protein